MLTSPLTHCFFSSHYVVVWVVAWEEGELKLWSILLIASVGAEASQMDSDTEAHEHDSSIIIVHLISC